jgi:hypothetical protein
MRPLSSGVAVVLLNNNNIADKRYLIYKSNGMSEYDVAIIISRSVPPRAAIAILHLDQEFLRECHLYRPNTSRDCSLFPAKPL